MVQPAKNSNQGKQQPNPGKGHKRDDGPPPKGKGKQPHQQQQNQPVSKKQIENEQQSILKQQQQQLEDAITQHEIEKYNKPIPINKSHTLVKNLQNALEKISDLSQYWLEKIEFLPFLPHNNQKLTVTVSEQSLAVSISGTSSISLAANEDIVQSLNTDLSKLLKMKYNKFWSHIIFDSTLQNFLDSFLRYYQRPFDIENLIELERLEKHSLGNSVQDNIVAEEGAESHLEMLYKRVFCVLLRMSSDREDAQNFIDRGYYSNIIYEKWLFDIPKLFDICVLYGNANRELCSKMIENIFTIQPKYNQDLLQSVQQITKLLDEVASRIHSADNSQSNNNQQSTVHLIDLSSYLLDILASLTAFLTVYSPGAKVFDVSILQALPEYYETYLPELLSKLHASLTPQQASLKHTSELQMKHMSRCILSISNSILQSKYFHGVLNRLDTKSNREKNSETLFQALDTVFSSSSSDSKKSTRSFLKDFATQYDLQYRLDELSKLGLNIDESRLNFFMSILNQLCGPYESVFVEVAPTQSEPVDTEYERVTKLINQVKELFADYGDGFIEEALKYFDMNPERVINSILESNLPPNLKSIDKNKKREAPKQAAPAPSVAPVLFERRNIYDDDEFDIMSRDRVDVNRIKKKGVTDDETFEKVFNDKSEIKQFKKFYQDYQYEDEYDDSYDQFTGNFKILTEQTKEETDSIVDTDSERGSDDELEVGRSIEVLIVKDIDEENEQGEVEEEDDDNKQRNKFRSGVQLNLPTQGRGRGIPPPKSNASTVNNNIIDEIAAKNILNNKINANMAHPANRGRGRGRGNAKAKSHNRKDLSLKKRQF